MADYAKVKEWRKRNPDKVAAQARRYRAKHPDKVKAVVMRYRAKPESKALDTLAARRRRAADPEGNKRRLRAYAERQEAKKVAIAGRPRSNYCEICAAEGRTVFDHSHQKGHFRGWICDRCNKILGLVRDDISYLKALQIYLEQLEYSIKEVA